MDGSVDVLENRALAQSSPINALVLIGKPKGVIDAFTDEDSQVIELPTANSYPIAGAASPTMVDRAGGLVYDVARVDTGDEQRLRTEAQRRLKAHLDQNGIGEIVTRPTTSMRPFSPFVTKPVVGTDTAADEHIAAYEVERARHHSVVDGNEIHSWSEFSVSPFTPPSEMAVVSDTVDIEQDQLLSEDEDDSTGVSQSTALEMLRDRLERAALNAEGAASELSRDIDS